MDPDIKVRVALDSDPADPAPIWTDITDRVHYGDGGQEVRVTIGRQDETGEIKPSEMSWALRNGDNLFTPNNSASPYAGRWEQGRRVQIAERVGVPLDDPFDRAVTGSWGAAPTGQTWINSGGTAANYAVAGGAGLHIMTAVNASRWSLAPSDDPFVDITAEVSTDALAAGGSQYVAVTGRATADGATCYLARLEATTAQAINLTLRKRIAGVESLIGGTVNTGLTHAVDVPIAVRLQVNESTLRVKAWLAGGAEPAGWLATETDGAVPDAGYIGARSILSTSNTNSLPVTATWHRIVTTGEEFLLGGGFLEIPTMEVVDSRSSQPVTVTAVDWMGRLDSAPPFEGTLHEQIRYAGGTLVEHFPLSDPYPHASSLTTATLARQVVGFDTSVAAAEPESLIEAAGLAGPPGDDQSYTRWAPISDGSVFLARAQLTSPVNVAVGATDVLAVSLWVHGQPDPGGYAYSGQFFNLLNSAPHGIILGDYGFNGSLTATWRTPGGDTDVALGRRLERDVWRLVTMRINAATGAIDLWCGADGVATGTATAPGAVTLAATSIAGIWVGGIGQVQVRVGPAASTMTRQMHLDQYAHGYQGLHRQTVADRIATLAGYAGVPTTEVDVSPACSTPMQVARLAGVNPAAALRAAAATGQDTLVTSGAGKLTAVPRAQRYQQAVAMQIPFGWIGWRGLRYRPDKPVTDVTVTRTRGGSVRRSDRTLAARYGVTGQQYDLDTAVDADPANLASWASTAHGQSRTRAPSIRISMLRRTVAERKALLALTVGDRIQITGLPAGSPDDVGHLIVQGIEHTIGPGRRRMVQFNTSPLLGPTPGVPPYCPMVGDLVSTTAIIAY